MSTSNLSELEARVRRRFRRLPKERLNEVLRDVKQLAAIGLRGEDDLLAFAANKDLDTSTRTIACWLGVRLRSKSDAIPVLRAIAADNHEPLLLRCEAVTSLGLTRSPKLVPLLADLARGAGQAELSETAVYALGFIRSTNSLNALVSIAQDVDETPRMRGEALEQIGCLKIPRRDVLAFLSTLLGHANVEIAFWAAYALGEIGDESVVPALVHTAAADNRELLPFGTIREEATKAIEMIHARAPAARHPSD